MTSTLANLRKRVARASTRPGVYRWLDAEGNIIYVGKAKNLRNRLKSYVMTNAAKGQGPWKESMIRQLADFDVTVTNSELEALMLETNLIKTIRPRYNVLMKDDKNYVYVRFSLQDEYPRIEVVRKIEKDPTSSRSAGLRGARGAKYFGPFLSPYEVRQTLDMLHEFFSFRACHESIDAMNKPANQQTSKPANKIRPCLDSQIGQCNGLCAGIISKEEYQRRIGQVMQFFKGDYDPVIARGKELMVVFATQKKFERAASVRDTLQMIEHLKQKQLVSDTSGDDVDVVGIAMLSGKSQVEVMQKRGGKLIGEHHIALMGNAENIGEVLEQFLPQYYENVVDLPEAVLVGEDFPGREALEEYLSQKRGPSERGRASKKVKVLIPERGVKSQLLQLAETNAHEKAKQAEATWEAEQRNIDTALGELVRNLELPTEPTRIECYDISHTGGTETVGSMVVFVNGKPRNDQYRSFTLRSIGEGEVNDYKSLKEVLFRRLRYLQNAEEEWNKNGLVLEKGKKADQSFIEDHLKRSGQVFAEAIDPHSFVVARHDGNIVGFGRIISRSVSVHLIQLLHVDEEFRGNKLGHAILHKLIARAKKGKIYITIHPELEEYYAHAGFRYVQTPPAIIQSEIDNAKANDPHFPEEGRIVMMYDIVQNKIDSSFTARPDLLVIDGGKGQLSTVVEVLKSMGLQIPVIGLAKREEEVFVPGKSSPIVFAKDSAAKFMLMRLRDEAHRFANHHRKKRASKHAIQSELDRIPGLGNEGKQKLLAAFGNVDNIRKQDDPALLEVINEEQVRALRQIL